MESHDKFVFLYERKVVAKDRTYNIVRVYPDLCSFEYDIHFHNIYLTDYVKKDIEHKIRSLFNKAVEKYVLIRCGNITLSLVPLRYIKEDGKYYLNEHLHIHYDR